MPVLLIGLAAASVTSHAAVALDTNVVTVRLGLGIRARRFAWARVARAGEGLKSSFHVGRIIDVAANGAKTGSKFFAKDSTIREARNVPARKGIYAGGASAGFGVVVEITQLQ